MRAPRPGWLRQLSHDQVPTPDVRTCWGTLRLAAGEQRFGWGRRGLRFPTLGDTIHLHRVTCFPRCRVSPHHCAKSPKQVLSLPHFLEMQNEAQRGPHDSCSHSQVQQSSLPAGHLLPGSSPQGLAVGWACDLGPPLGPPRGESGPGTTGPSNSLESYLRQAAPCV